MNSKVKGIIAGAVVLVCLGAMLVILQVTGAVKTDKDGESSSDGGSIVIEEEETFPLMDIDRNSVSKISFENESGTLNIVRTKKSTSEESSSEWTMEELEGINQNGTAVKACVNICSSLAGRALVEENASDLSRYGLSEPSAIITVSSDNEADSVFLIGDEIPTGGYRYIVRKGSSTVYTALNANINYFLQGAEYFCSLSLVYTPSQESWPRIERLTVKRDDLDYDMVFVSVDEDDAPVGLVSSQVMIKPVYAGLNITTSASVTHGIWGLTAASAEVIHPTEEDFAQYGLTEPHCTVILDSSAEDYTLKIGDPVYAKDENGEELTTVAGYYCYINAEGADCIYIIAAESCVWPSFLPGDIIGGQMAMNYIMDLSGITVEYSSGSDRVDINAVKEDKDAGIEEVFEVSINSKPVDGSLFKNWYVYWLECPTNETFFEPLSETDTLYCTVTIERRDADDQVLKFYQTSGRRLIVEIDGNVGYKIPISYIDTLITNLHNVAEGKNIVETY